MSALLANARNGRASKAPPKVTSEVTAEALSIALRSRFNPLRGITPQLLSQQLDNFMLGFVAFAALTWDSIERRDDVLRNVASKRKKAVARLKRESLQREESDEAAAHAEALDEFYDNLSVVNALDQNERGGLSLLIRQMMDAAGKYYAVHEIVWQPGGGPGRAGGDVLTAELRFVPLWFFENRTGRLRFLTVPLGGAEGTDLEDGGWMITKGDGLMEACSIAYMFKNLPLKDWLAYSDKFGTPGVLGQTNAAQGSTAGAAIKAAVESFGQNWSGVVYGADGAIKEPISVIRAEGAGDLPFPPLIERMDRAMASLWRGSDLSTMSADMKGASVQDGETEILLADDAEMIGDTLNYYIDRWVIFQKFGTMEMKAQSRLIVPEKENTELDLKVDDLLLRAGAQIGMNERLEHYGRPQMDPKDTPLKNPTAVTERITDALKGGVAGASRPSSVDLGRDGPATLANERAHEIATAIVGEAALATLLKNSVQAVSNAVAEDLQPIARRLGQVIAAPDAEFANELAAFSRELPALCGVALKNPHAAEAFKQALSIALVNGLAQRAPAE